MFSDSDDEILFDNATLRILLTSSRQYNVHPINKRRNMMGQYHNLFLKQKKYPEKFFEYVRMSLSTFNYILEKVAGHLTKKWTNFIRQPIGPEERLVVTLRLVKHR